MSAVLRDRLSDAARASRFMVVSDILQVFSDGIDGDRLNALMEFGRDGAASDQDALLRAFEAPWLAAREAGAWKGNAVRQAKRDLTRVAALALNPLPGAGPLNDKHGPCLQKGDRLIGITALEGEDVTFERVDPDRPAWIYVRRPNGRFVSFPTFCFGYAGGPA